MASDSSEWLQGGFDIYRLARAELERWKGIRPADTELDFYVEELKDALLELKLATIEQDAVGVIQSIDEVTLLLIELRLRSEGNP